MKIAIIGDSFSSNSETGSWPELLSKTHTIKNYSCRSISEYRIFNILTENLSEIYEADAIIMWHTNPDRVYVNDEIIFPTRKLKLYSCADLVASDSLNSSDSNWKNITKNYYKVFYNQDQQLFYYQLILEKINTMLSHKKVIHCSGFNVTSSFKIKSFDYILANNPGNINHYNLEGNLIVFNYLKSKL